MGYCVDTRDADYFDEMSAWEANQQRSLLSVNRDELNAAWGNPKRTPKPTKEPKTPRPTAWKAPKTPKPTHPPKVKTPKPTNTPKPTYNRVKTPRPSKTTRPPKVKTPRPTEWEAPATPRPTN